MLREKNLFFRRLIMIFDAALVTLAFYTAYHTHGFLRGIYRIDIFPGTQLVKQLSFIESYLPMLLMFVPLWILFMIQAGVYDSFRRHTVGQVFYFLFRAGLFTLLGFGLFTVAFKLPHISRSFIILLFSYSFGFLALEKIGLLLFFRGIRRKGFNSRNLLLVGTGGRMDKFIKDIEARKEWGFRIIGIVDLDSAKAGKNYNGSEIKILGSIEDIPHILRHKVVDEVIFVVSSSALGRVEKAVLDCEMQGVPCYVALDVFNLNIGRLRQTDFEDLPLLSIETTVGKEWQRFAKRGIDFFGSALWLVILSPLFLFVAAGIKITSPRGKILFRQVRSGLNGRKFLCYKFRTMEAGAHAKLKGLRAQNEMQGPVFKLSRDPRVTRFGKFLRKFSIDELPQLWNVLWGEMSLVGPRPPLPTEVRKYELCQRRRLSMKPGLTCLWQIKGRNKISSFDDWLKLDLEYIDNWSLWEDSKILARTVPAVLFGVGAK